MFILPLKWEGWWFGRKLTEQIFWIKCNISFSVNTQMCVGNQLGCTMSLNFSCIIPCVFNININKKFSLIKSYFLKNNSYFDGFFLWKNVNNIWVRGSEDYIVPRNVFNVVYKIKEQRKKHEILLELNFWRNSNCFVNYSD